MRPRPKEGANALVVASPARRVMRVNCEVKLRGINDYWGGK